VRIYLPHLTRRSPRRLVLCQRDELLGVGLPLSFARSIRTLPIEVSWRVYLEVAPKEVSPLVHIMDVLSCLTENPCAQSEACGPTGHSAEDATGGSGCPVLLPRQFRDGYIDGLVG